MESSHSDLYNNGEPIQEMERNTLMKRCILIFPEFSNMGVIEQIRAKYDPLAKHVRPHITLVFPFDSDLSSTDMHNHLRHTLSGSAPFPLALESITPVRSHGNYLFLNVKQGADELTALHNKLYSGILEQYKPEWLKNSVYRPHLTVGRVPDETHYLAAIADTSEVDELFSTTVYKVSVEIIAVNDDSILEIEVALGGRVS